MALLHTDCPYITDTTSSLPLLEIPLNGWLVYSHIELETGGSRTSLLYRGETSVHYWTFARTRALSRLSRRCVLCGQEL